MYFLQSRSKDSEAIDSNKSASNSRPQNLCTDLISSTPNSLWVLAHTPNHIHNDYTLHIPPHSPHNTCTLRDHHLEEPIAQANPSHQMINLEDLGNPGIQKCMSNQDFHLSSTGAYETTYLSEQEISSNQRNKTGSNTFSDNVSLVETSGYQSAENSLPKTKGLQWDYDHDVFKSPTTPEGTLINPSCTTIIYYYYRLCLSICIL